MKNIIIKRLLSLPDTSFFLFGPRGTGKSTWLKQVLPNAVYFDLLDSSLYLELSQNPHKIESMAGNLKKDDWIIVDEIQKIPILLDEIHRLIETHKRTQFSKPSIICIEVKLTDKWQKNYEKSLLSINENNNINIEHMFGVYCGSRAYYYKNLTILPVYEFLKWLYQDKIF